MTLANLASQPPGTPWPTREWPAATVRARDKAALLSHIAYAFSDEPPPDLGETHALVVVQRGRLVLERYWRDLTATNTFPSWSMAKSMTHALSGFLVSDGRIDIHGPAPVPEWGAPDDPRAAITLDLLLRMSSGLAFIEEYRADFPSDVIRMLWHEGAADVGHFAASFPLEHTPGTFWSYSSGTTNIVSRVLADAIGAHGAAFESFMRARLFDPLGMRSPTPKFDAAGTFIGSSFCFCTAQDFARFGYFYARDGVWESERLLPAGWVDYARTPTWQQPTDSSPYGAHWWLDLAGPGTFSANGYEGQFIVVIPQSDTVIVRLGKTPAEQNPNVKQWIKRIADLLE